MLNLKNVHLLWIMTVLSAATVTFCLTFLVSEKTNATGIAQLNRDLAETQKNLADTTTILGNDIRSLRADLDALRADSARTEKDLVSTKKSFEAGLKRRPWDNDLATLKKRLDEIATVLKKPASP